MLTIMIKKNYEKYVSRLLIITPSSDINSFNKRRKKKITLIKMANSNQLLLNLS